MATPISAATLKAWLRDGEELAILDAREEGEFARSHLFWAVPCPLSRKEWRARLLLPRRGVRIVCTDGGEGSAQHLAAYLEGIGYRQTAILAGGTPAWEAAGYTCFSGVNVPSKAFGEWVEHCYGTPSLAATELAALMQAGADLMVLDSRPFEEFHRMSIPGAINVPGGELVYRIDEIVKRPETLIVVNCAGRTRSILGAESLRQAGVPNRVMALRNGTMGWELAGLACAHGRTERYPDITPTALERALARADRFARRHGVGFITRADYRIMAAQRERTTYLLDVRDPSEFARGHLAGSLCAPGGQLVQATDRWVAVRGARLVLVDDTGVRARMTAAWLRQLGGWEVYVMTDALDGACVCGDPPLPCPEAEAVAVPAIEAVALHALLERGLAQVVDLAPSIAFRAGHIPGAWWGIRTRLVALAPYLAPDRTIVVSAPEPALANLGADELRRLGYREVRVLEGGTAAWKAAGLPLIADRRSPPDAACIDVYLRPYDRHEGVEAAMREYLAWEIDLLRQVEQDGDAPFGAWG